MGDVRQGVRMAGHAPTLLGKPSTDGTRGQKSREATGRPLVPELTMTAGKALRSLASPHNVPRVGTQGPWCQLLEPGIPRGTVTS